ncbi:MAG TPA: polysaccharide biosynthesis C-terminal domain-containing protein [Bacteroidales bacterium]|nr:polysaccharide biosynthesis C-terminal domain-containing protein [Bacteroidales bacterium]HOX77690.1 polysaccharide biosynthesis C-terminal domain-containing protein [Bacteroidales bacterium]
MFGKIINTFGTRALAAVINLGIAIALSQYLGPAGKGVQSLIITTITFVLVFANLVGGATLVYLVPRREPSLLLLPSIVWTLVVSALSFAILQVFPLVDKTYSAHICILSAINSFTSITTSILIGREKIRAANAVGLVQPAVLILSLFLFFGNSPSPGVDHYIWSLYFSFIFSAIAGMIYYQRYCGKIRFFGMAEYLKVSLEMARYGVLNQVAHVTQMLSFRLSFYVLDRYHGEAAVGIYSNGISIAESIWLIAKSISLVQYARISNLNNREESAKLTVSLMKFSLAASLVLILPVLLLPESFYLWVFGEGFGEMRYVIQALAGGVLVYNFSILAGHYFSGTGRYQVNAITSTLGLIASIILYYSMIPSLGITGAGFATSLSYLFTSLILMYLFGREYKTWYREIIPVKGDLIRLRDGLKEMMNKKPGS